MSMDYSPADNSERYKSKRVDSRSDGPGGLALDLRDMELRGREDLRWTTKNKTDENRDLLDDYHLLRVDKVSIEGGGSAINEGDEKYARNLADKRRDSQSSGRVGQQISTPTRQINQENKAFRLREDRIIHSSGGAQKRKSPSGNRPDEIYMESSLNRSSHQELSIPRKKDNVRRSTNISINNSNDHMAPVRSRFDQIATHPENDNLLKGFVFEDSSLNDRNKRGAGLYRHRTMPNNNTRDQENQPLYSNNRSDKTSSQGDTLSPLTNNENRRFTNNLSNGNRGRKEGRPNDGLTRLGRTSLSSGPLGSRRRKYAPMDEDLIRSDIDASGGLESFSKFKKAEGAGASICVCAAAKHSERERVQLKALQEKLKNEANRIKLKDLELDEEIRKNDRLFKDYNRRISEVNKTEHYCDERQRLLKSFEDTLKTEKSKLEKKKASIRENETLQVEKRKQLAKDCQLLETNMTELNNKELEINQLRTEVERKSIDLNNKIEALASAEKKFELDRLQWDERLAHFEDDEHNLRAQLDRVQVELREIEEQNAAIEKQRNLIELNHSQKMDELQFRESLLENQEQESATLRMELEEWKIDIETRTKSLAEEKANLEELRKDINQDKINLNSEKSSIDRLAQERIAEQENDRENLSKWEEELRTNERNLNEREELFERTRIEIEDKEEDLSKRFELLDERERVQAQREDDLNQLLDNACREEVERKLQIQSETDEIEKKIELLTVKSNELHEKERQIEERESILDNEDHQSSWVKEVKRTVTEEKQQLQMRHHQVRLSEEKLIGDKEAFCRGVALERERLAARAAELKSFEAELLRLERRLRLKEISGRTSPHSSSYNGDDHKVENRRMYAQQYSRKEPSPSSLIKPSMRSSPKTNSPKVMMHQNERSTSTTTCNNIGISSTVTRTSRTNNPFMNDVNGEQRLISISPKNHPVLTNSTSSLSNMNNECILPPERVNVSNRIDPWLPSSSPVLSGLKSTEFIPDKNLKYNNNMERSNSSGIMKQCLQESDKPDDNKGLSPSNGDRCNQAETSTYKSEYSEMPEYSPMSAKRHAALSMLKISSPYTVHMPTVPLKENLRTEENGVMCSPSELTGNEARAAALASIFAPDDRSSDTETNSSAYNNDRPLTNGINVLTGELSKLSSAIDRMDRRFEDSSHGPTSEI